MNYTKADLPIMLDFLEKGQRATIQALIDHGTQAKAAKHMGITQSSFQERVARAIKNAQLNGWMPDFASTHRLPAGMRMKGISAYVDEAGLVQRSWLKMEQDRDAGIKLMLDNLGEILESYKGAAKPVPLGKPKGGYDKDLMSWYPIGDHHFGMYAWAEETGVDYDTEIAGSLLRDAIDKLVNASPVSESAAILNVGDFFHMDNTKNVTNQSGNILDVDTRWTKVVQVGVNALRYCVERALQKHRKVHLFNVMGNHDTHSATALSMVMSAIYENEPRVEVHVTANTFQYHEFGKCMVGMNHGDTVKKRENYVGIMARDMPEMWGRTRFRYWWLGHIHNSQREELPGCLLETFRTLAARDAWHASMGYGSGRDMTCIVLHREYGEIERHTVPVQMISKYK